MSAEQANSLNYLGNFYQFQQSVDIQNNGQCMNPNTFSNMENCQSEPVDYSQPTNQNPSSGPQADTPATASVGNESEIPYAPNANVYSYSSPAYPMTSQIDESQQSQQQYSYSAQPMYLQQVNTSLTSQYQSAPVSNDVYASWANASTTDQRNHRSHQAPPISSSSYAQAQSISSQAALSSAGALPPFPSVATASQAQYTSQPHVPPLPNSSSYAQHQQQEQQLQFSPSPRTDGQTNVLANNFREVRANAMPQLYPPPPQQSKLQNQAPHAYPQNSQQLQSPSHGRYPRNINSTVEQQQQQIYGSQTRQHANDRTPGAALSADEWNNLACPVNLLTDSNFLPSDGPEKPRPPSVFSKVNCSPDFMRSTLTAIPVSSKLLSKCRMPLGLLVQPFRDVNDLPVIENSAIVRCRSCRLYINPFVKFIDNGRRWRCPVCLVSNVVPDEFFMDPATRTYGDPTRRPEIRSATVEFIAPTEYMLRPPQAATYVFCLEVSRSAIATGYLDLVCNMLADMLGKLPGDPRRQIALLTYNSGVQFYVLSGKKMRMVICPDVTEVFLPDLNGLVNRIVDCSEPITELLRQLPSEFVNTQETSNCLGFALQTALKLIGHTGGRVTVFNTSLPSVGPGALECRETHDDLSKPDPTHLCPSNDFYRTIALDFTSAQISVDMFFLNSNYCDIATISGVSRYSGGSVYHYPGFHYDPEARTQSTAPTDAQGDANGVQASGMPQQPKKKLSPLEMCDYVEVESLRKDFHRYLTRKIGFEAVLRLRCTRGIAVQNFYGNFFMRSVDLLNLPVVNPDAGYAMQLEINEKLDNFSTVVFQSALLYTSAYGDRRIRVHTLCLPVTDSAETVFNYADEGAVACLVAKMAVERTISSGLGNAREALTAVMTDLLTAYQNERAGGSRSSSSLSGLCPASLRLLPTYLCGALRFTAFRNHLPTSLDVRSGALELIVGASAHRTLTLLYPRLYAVNSFISSPICGTDATLALKAATLSLNDAPPAVMPLPCLPLTGKSISRDGIFVLDTGSVILLLVGYGIPAQDLKSLIGYSSIDELVVERGLTKLGDLPEGEKPPPPRRRLQSLLKAIQRDRSLGMALIPIRHDVPEPLKGRFINALVEDRTSAAPSYSEYLQMILNGRS